MFGWQKKAVELIEQCKEQGRKNKQIYYVCLKRNLDQNIKILSLPCKELGEKKVWSEQKCGQLVSFIFMKNFVNILESSRSPSEQFMSALDRMSQTTFMRFVFNPVAAIFVFILFVLDVVFLMEKGTWMKVTRTGFIVGPLILILCFTQEGIRLLSSGFVIVVIFMFIVWNHLKFDEKSEKKKPTPIEF